MWWKIILIILGVIIVLIASFITIGNAIFKRKVNSEVEKLFRERKDVEPKVVTEEDIKGLPEPVQRYLRYSQIIGKEKIGTVRLKQKGLFRMKEGQKWMSLDAEQYYTTDPPAYIWCGSIEPFPLVSVKARDTFHEGKGNMLIKLLGLVKVADASGPEMDQGTLVRYLNEIMWFPTAYLNDNIQWEPINSDSAKATISVNGLTASAVFYFNENGGLKNFIAERYGDEDGKQVLRTWSTPILEYKEINGIRIPSKGEAIYHLSSGDFKYIEVEITDIELGLNNISVFTCCCAPHPKFRQSNAKGTDEK